MIFIGGTGRSGTTVAARMFLQDPRFAVLIEPRFLTGEGGLLDYIENDTMPRAEFVENMLGRFQHRMLTNLVRFSSPSPYNPATIYTRARIEQLDYRAAMGSQTREQYAKLFVEFLYQMLHNEIRTSVGVYKDPHLILQVSQLNKLFPESHFIHVIRDPRDVCSSVIGRKWGPSNAQEFVGWYNSIMATAWEQMEKVPWANYMVISIEEIVKDSNNAMLAMTTFAGQRFVTEDILAKVRSTIVPGLLHKGRYKVNLTRGEASSVRQQCKQWYTQWLDRSTV